MNEEQIERLITALEEINSNLADISASFENLDQNVQNCIARNGSSSFLCVTGNFTSY